MAVRPLSLEAFRAGEAVERAKADPAAFGELYDRHFLEIYRFVYRRVGDQTLAEDLTAEVFFKALRKLHQYRDRGRPFVCWLYRIADNMVKDHFRRDRPCYELEDVGPVAENDDLLNQILKRDEARRVWQAIERLPAGQRLAMTLRFADDLPLAVIADLMSRSEGAIKLLIFRAVHNLRRELPPRDQI